jgi:hypothetical protein
MASSELGKSNDKVQHRSRQESLHTSESRDASPVCYNDCFGPGTLNVPNAGYPSPSATDRTLWPVARHGPPPSLAGAFII